MHPDQILRAPQCPHSNDWLSLSFSIGFSWDYFHEKTTVYATCFFSWFNIRLDKKCLPAPEQFLALTFNVAPLTLEPESIIELLHEMFAFANRRGCCCARLPAARGGRASWGTCWAAWGLCERISVVEVVNAVKKEWSKFVLAPEQSGESTFIVGYSAMVPTMIIESTAREIPEVTWELACVESTT